MFCSIVCFCCFCFCYCLIILRGWLARKNANNDTVERDRLEREWIVMDKNRSGELSLEEVTEVIHMIIY